MFKKLSVIRDNDECTCPFGLSVPNSCQSVGKAIDLMSPLDVIEEKERGKIKKENKIIYLTQKTNEQCPFADQILKEFDKVNCDFGEPGAKEKSTILPGSPLYPRIFYNHGLTPGDKIETNYDPRYVYFDAQERYYDVPFGIYSIFASRINELNFIKIAEKYTNNYTNIKDKLALLRDKYFNTLKLIIPSSSVVKLSDKQLETLLIVINDWIK